jgi:hypothetical protein
LVPSDRVIVPRSAELALPAAVTFPVACTGGHALAHAPVQVDTSLVSAAHTYTARPELLISTGPAELVAVAMTVADAAAALPVVPAPGLVADDVAAPLLLHAAASSAAAARGTPSLTAAGTRRAFRGLVTGALPRLRRPRPSCACTPELLLVPVLK